MTPKPGKVWLRVPLLCAHITDAQHRCRERECEMKLAHVVLLGSTLGHRSWAKVDRRKWCMSGVLDAFAYRKFMEYGRLHSGLMPANFTTFSHFSVSSAMS